MFVFRKDLENAESALAYRGYVDQNIEMRALCVSLSKQLRVHLKRLPEDVSSIEIAPMWANYPACATTLAENRELILETIGIYEAAWRVVAAEALPENAPMPRLYSAEQGNAFRVAEYLIEASQLFGSALVCLEKLAPTHAHA